MDRGKEQRCVVPARRLLACVDQQGVSQNEEVCAISDAISTSTSPSDTHRFVRLFLTDASQGVRSVRPAHRGVSSGREGGSERGQGVL